MHRRLTHRDFVVLRTTEPGKGTVQPDIVVRITTTNRKED